MSFGLALRGCALALILGITGGCAHHFPRGRASGLELYKEQKCFAHELPAWRHYDLRELAGTVWAGGTGQREPLPDNVVYVRAWPNGAVRSTRSDNDGTFVLPDLPAGLYEVAVCRGGWDPWLGTVHVSRHARRARGGFEVKLAW